MLHFAPCRALLEEKSVTSSSRWSKQRDAMAKDARYKALKRPDRDQVFKAYVAELEVCTDVLPQLHSLQPLVAQQ
jgi:FF domain